MSILVSLPNDIVEYLDEQIRIGRFASRSDVVVAALRSVVDLESDTKKQQWLRSAVQAGIESGDFAPLDFQEVKDSARRRFLFTPE